MRPTTTSATPGPARPVLAWSSSAPHRRRRAVSGSRLGARATATIHPGVQMFTAGAQCTGNFVFNDAPAGSTSGTPPTAPARAPRPTPTGAAPARTRSAPGSASRTGAPSPTSGTTVGRGTLVYSSWITMHAARHRRQRLRRQRLRAGPGRRRRRGPGQPERPLLGRPDRHLHGRCPAGQHRLLVGPVEPAADHRPCPRRPGSRWAAPTVAGAGTSTPRHPASPVTPAAASSTLTDVPSARSRPSPSPRSRGPTASVTWSGSCATPRPTPASAACGSSPARSRSRPCSDRSQP